VVTIASTPQPPETIDNVILNPTSDSSSDGETNYSIAHRSGYETDGSVVFTVKRNGAVANIVNLAYRTEDGSASAGADYEHAEGTLQFAAGETEKTVTIRLFADTLNEHLAETFRLKLSDGADIALEARATLQDATTVINLLAIDSGFQMTGPGQAQLGTALAPGGATGQTSSSGKSLDSLWIAAPGDNDGHGVLYFLRGQSAAEAVDTGLNLDAPGPATSVIKVTGTTSAAAAAPQRRELARQNENLGGRQCPEPQRSGGHGR
jgi:hypothetical protein